MTKYNKMLGFIKNAFFSGLTILSSVNPLSATPLKCISMTNQECKVRPEIFNFNSDEPVFYPLRIKTSKCSGRCNNINDSFAKMCVPDVANNLNVKVFNLMSRTNKTRHIKWHAGVYLSTFVYSRFFPKIEFFYCLHENAYPTHFLALKNTLSIADKHP